MRKNKILTVMFVASCLLFSLTGCNSDVPQQHNKQILTIDSVDEYISNMQINNVQSISMERDILLDSTTVDITIKVNAIDNYNNKYFLDIFNDFKNELDNIEWYSIITKIYGKIDVVDVYGNILFEALIFESNNNQECSIAISKYTLTKEERRLLKLPYEELNKKGDISDKLMQLRRQNNLSPEVKQDIQPDINRLDNESWNRGLYDLALSASTYLNRYVYKNEEENKVDWIIDKLSNINPNTLSTHQNDILEYGLKYFTTKEIWIDAYNQKQERRNKLTMELQREINEYIQQRYSYYDYGNKYGDKYTPIVYREAASKFGFTLIEIDCIWGHLWSDYKVRI